MHFCVPILHCLFLWFYDVALDHHLTEEGAGCLIFHCFHDFINLCIFVCLFSTVYSTWFCDVVLDHHLTEEERVGCFSLIVSMLVCVRLNLIVFNFFPEIVHCALPSFFVINYFISETTSYNIYKHNTFYHAQVLCSHYVK